MIVGISHFPSLIYNFIIYISLAMAVPDQKISILIIGNNDQLNASLIERYHSSICQVLPIIQSDSFMKISPSRIALRSCSSQIITKLHSPFGIFCHLNQELEWTTKVQKFAETSIQRHDCLFYNSIAKQLRVYFLRFRNRIFNLIQYEQIKSNELLKKKEILFLFLGKE